MAELTDIMDNIPPEDRKEALEAWHKKAFEMRLTAQDKQSSAEETKTALDIKQRYVYGALDYL